MSHTIIPWQCSNTPGEIFGEVICWQPEALNFGRRLDLSGNYMYAPQQLSVRRCTRMDKHHGIPRQIRFARKS